MRLFHTVLSRSGPVLLTVLLATVLVLPTDAVAATGSGTRPLRGLALDAVTIPELQERMRAGVLTAVELTQAYLDRIAAVNDEVGAVLRVNPLALEEAADSIPSAPRRAHAVRWRASRSCSRTTWTPRRRRRRPGPARC